MLQIIRFIEEIYNCSLREDFLSNYNEKITSFAISFLLNETGVIDGKSYLLQPTSRYLYYVFIIYTIKRYVKRKANIFYIYKNYILQTRSSLSQSSSSSTNPSIRL